MKSICVSTSKKTVFISRFLSALSRTGLRAPGSGRRARRRALKQAVAGRGQLAPGTRRHDSRASAAVGSGSTNWPSEHHRTQQRFRRRRAVRARRAFGRTRQHVVIGETENLLRAGQRVFVFAQLGGVAAVAGVLRAPPFCRPRPATARRPTSPVRCPRRTRRWARARPPVREFCIRSDRRWP